MAKNVVIIGGGLSSKHAAEILSKKKDLKVTIIQGNRFVEWPLAMTYVMVNPDSHDRAIAPNPEDFQCPGVEYKYGVAMSVDAEAKSIKLANGEVVPYDALIVATGFGMPLVYPKLGVSLADRKEEIQQVGGAIKDAGCVVVAGGGPVGLELSGDIRARYPDKRVILLVRDVVLGQWPDSFRAKVEAQLKAMNIEIMSGASNAPAGYSFEPGSLLIQGSEIKYDVFIPAYSQGPNTQFLLGMPGLLDPKGNVIVNTFLQSVAQKEIFAIGVSDVQEWVGMPKLEGQWKSVSGNVQMFLAGGQLKPHTESNPGMKLPPATLIGHGPRAYGYLDFNNVPPPVKCCCCCGLGGFPFCPPPCCWPCCGLCTCGYCCGPSEGSGFAKFMEGMAFKSSGFHFKGVGQAPKQQTMG